MKGINRIRCVQGIVDEWDGAYDVLPDDDESDENTFIRLAPEIAKEIVVILELAARNFSVIHWQERAEAYVAALGGGSSHEDKCSSEGN